MAGPAGCAIAPLGALGLALLCVGNVSCGNVCAEELLRLVGTHEADEGVDCGLVGADSIEQGVRCGIGILAGCDSVLPGLGRLLCIGRGGRRSEHLVDLLRSVVTDNRYGVCPSLLRDQRTILTVVGTARWLVFSLTPQGCLLLESPRAIPVTRGPAMT